MVDGISTLQSGPTRSSKEPSSLHPSERIPGSTHGEHAFRPSKPTTHDGTLSATGARVSHPGETSGSSGGVEMLGPADGKVTLSDGTYSAVPDIGTALSDRFPPDAARPPRPRASHSKSAQSTPETTKDAKCRSCSQPPHALDPASYPKRLVFHFDILALRFGNSLSYGTTSPCPLPGKKAHTVPAIMNPVPTTTINK